MQYYLQHVTKTRIAQVLPQGATTTSYPNRITIVDGSNTYSVEGYWFFGGHTDRPDTYVNVSIKKSTSKSVLRVMNERTLNNGSANIPFEINFFADGPTNGSGTFTVDKDGLYIENFQNGERYDVDGGAANITTSRSDRIIGTFTINLSNSNGSKTISGDFDVKEPGDGL